jgi:hypothetical protein
MTSKDDSGAGPEHALQRPEDDGLSRPPLRLERAVTWMAVGLALVFAVMVGVIVTGIIAYQRQINESEAKVERLACTVVAFFKPGQSELIDALSRQYRCRSHPVPLGELLPPTGTPRTTIHTEVVPGPTTTLRPKADRTVTISPHPAVTPGPTVTRTRQVPGPGSTVTVTATATKVVPTCPPRFLCVPPLL